MGGPSQSRTIPNVIAAAVAAVNASKFDEARAVLSLPAEVDDRTVFETASSLSEGIRLESRSEYAQAAVPLSRALAILRQSSDGPLVASISLMHKICAAHFEMSRDNFGTALEILDDVSANQASFLAAHPYLGDQVAYAIAMSHQVRMKQALQRDDLTTAVEEANREASILQELERERRVPADAELYSLDTADRLVAGAAIRALAAFRQPDLGEMKLILAGFQTEVAALEAALTSGKLSPPVAADVQGLLAARRALIGLYRVESGDFTSTGAMARLPRVRSKDIEQALVELSNCIARTGARGGFLADLQHQLRKAFTGISSRPPKRSAADVPERRAAFALAAIVAVLGFALIWGTEIRNQPFVALIVIMLLLPLVFMAGALAVLGYKKALAFVPGVLVPILNFVREIATGITGAGGSGRRDDTGRSDDS